MKDEAKQYPLVKKVWQKPEIYLIGRDNVNDGKAFAAFNEHSATTQSEFDFGKFYFFHSGGAQIPGTKFHSLGEYVS